MLSFLARSPQRVARSRSSECHPKPEEHHVPFTENPQRPEGVAAAGALALGGSALAGAATNSGATTQQSALGPRPDPRTPGGHVGTNGKTEMALSGDVAAIGQGSGPSEGLRQVAAVETMGGP